MRRFIRHTAVSGIFAAFTLSGCVDTAQTSTRNSLTEGEFREEVVGERLVWDGGETRFFADGTFSGTSGDETLEGKWAFEEGRYCRSGSVGGRAFPHACERVTIEGDTLTFFGTNGVRYIYTIDR